MNHDNESLADASSGDNEETKRKMISNDTHPSPSLYVDPIRPTTPYQHFPQSDHARQARLPQYHNDDISSPPFRAPNTFVPSKRTTVQIIGYISSNTNSKSNRGKKVTFKKKSSKKVVKIRRIISDTTIIVEDWLYELLSTELGIEILRDLFGDDVELSLGPNQSFHVDSATDNLRGEKRTNGRKCFRLELVTSDISHVLLSPRDPIFYLLDWNEEFILRVVGEGSWRSADAIEEGGLNSNDGVSNNNNTSKESPSGLPPLKKKARKHIMQQENIKHHKDEKQQELSTTSHSIKATKTTTSMITNTPTTNERGTATNTEKMTKTTSQKHQRNSKSSKNDDDHPSESTGKIDEAGVVPREQQNDDDRAEELINHSVNGVLNLTSDDGNDVDFKGEKDNGDSDDEENNVLVDSTDNEDDGSTKSGKEDQDNRTGQKNQDNQTTGKVVKRKLSKKKSQCISDCGAGKTENNNYKQKAKSNNDETLEKEQIVNGNRDEESTADIVGHGNDAKEDNVLLNGGVRKEPSVGFGDRDVLLGKGKEQQQNSGNAKYSDHIKLKSPEYTMKKKRSAIINSLTSTFCFYKKKNETGLWNKVESTEVIISNKIKRDFTNQRSVEDKIEIKKVSDVEKGAQDTTAKFSDCDRDCKDNSPSNERNINGDEDPPEKNDQKVQEEGVSEGNDSLSDETLMNENNEEKEGDEELEVTGKSKKNRKSNLLEGKKNSEKQMEEIRNDAKTNELKERNEKLEDTRKSKKKRKSTVLQGEKKNEKQMDEIRNDTKTNEVKERDEKLEDTRQLKKRRKSKLLQGEKNNEKQMDEIRNDAKTKEGKIKATNMEDDVNGGHGDDDSSSASSSSSTTSDSSDSDSSSSSSSSSSSDSSSGSSSSNKDDSNSTISKKQSKVPNAVHLNAAPAPAPAQRKSPRKSLKKKPLLDPNAEFTFPEKKKGSRQLS